MGGETQAELSLTASSLWDGGGVGLMVCPVQEEDVGEGAKQGYDEWVWEKIISQVMQSVAAAGETKS